MARKNLEEPKTLQTLIPKYGEHKAQFDELKKIVDAENKDIKILMKQQNQLDTTVDGWCAKYIVQKRESINENKLISILKADATVTLKAENLGIIKTKRYIDYDALEKAIYDGEFTPEILAQFNDAREIKEVETLRISKLTKED